MDNELSKEQENFCEMCGLFGVLLSLACFIQHLTFISGNWLEIAMAGTYLLAITSFILLMKKSWYAVVLVVISTAILLIQLLFMLMLTVVSVVVILLFLYLLTIMLLLLVAGTAQKLKLKHVAEKAEAAGWQQKFKI